MSAPADANEPVPPPAAPGPGLAEVQPPGLPAQLARLQRLLRLSLGLIAVLFTSQAFVLYLVFAIILAEPAQIEGVTQPDAAEGAEEEGDYREEMRDFFERTSDLLDREARKQGVNPADVLPSDAEINDAVETRTMHSDESQRVLQKLREGFEFFDLTWPLVVPER